MKTFADDIKADGGEAHAFPIESYAGPSIQDAFAAIKTQWPSSPLRVALFNTAYGAWKPFMQVTQKEIQESVDTNIVAAFAFAHEVIAAFQAFDPDQGSGTRGTLLFTGAGSSLKTSDTNAVLAAGKTGVRALAMGLAKEFGKDDIHVAHVIIDGTIVTDRTRQAFPAEKLENLNTRLSPSSIGNSYMYLVNQDKSAWTWELDLRPAHEQW